MKIFGCSKNEPIVFELEEASIQSSLYSIKELSNFILNVVNAIEQKHEKISAQSFNTFSGISNSDFDIIITTDCKQ